MLVILNENHIPAKAETAIAIRDMIFEYFISSRFLSGYKNLLYKSREKVAPIATNKPEALDIEAPRIAAITIPAITGVNDCITINEKTLFFTSG
jgi:hypothetical protein